MSSLKTKISRIALAGLITVAGLATASPVLADGMLTHQKNLFEIGLFGGVHFAPETHELYNTIDLVGTELDGVAKGIDAYNAVKNLQPHHPLQSPLGLVGLRIGYLPVNWLGLEVEGGVMPFNKTAPKVASGTPPDAAKLLGWTARAHLLLQYPARLAPFLVVGGGALGVMTDDADTNPLTSGALGGNDVDFTMHWGLGLKYQLSRLFQLRVDARHIIGGKFGNFDDGEVTTTTTDANNVTTTSKSSDLFDGVEQPGKLANHWEGLLSLAFTFGFKDHVPAPVDTDGDGVPDETDNCPQQPAQTVDGCPTPTDTDGDGVDDTQDMCPQEPASTPNGCPVKDSDGDGVTDDIDKCPEQPASTPDGCPEKDTDGDGIPDSQDKCIDEPETVNGFEDTDGCKDEIPKAIKRFEGAIKGIRFASGRSTIKTRSFRTLNKCVKVLEQYSDVKLEISGHTDSKGGHDSNVELSRERAIAVKEYLVSHGIAEGRLRTMGYGPDQPVASNKSRRGRAKNRRIEFHLDTGAVGPGGGTEAPADQ